MFTSVKDECQTCGHHLRSIALLTPNKTNNEPFTLSTPFHFISSLSINQNKAKTYIVQIQPITAKPMNKKLGSTLHPFRGRLGFISESFLSSFQALTPHYRALLVQSPRFLQNQSKMANPSSAARNQITHVVFDMDGLLLGISSILTTTTPFILHL